MEDRSPRRPELLGACAGLQHAPPARGRPGARATPRGGGCHATRGRAPRHAGEGATRAPAEREAGARKKCLSEEYKEKTDKNIRQKRKLKKTKNKGKMEGRQRRREERRLGGKGGDDEAKKRDREDRGRPCAEACGPFGTTGSWGNTGVTLAGIWLMNPDVQVALPSGAPRRPPRATHTPHGQHRRLRLSAGARVSRRD